MYYQNGNYMQDLNYYNQIPNPNAYQMNNQVQPMMRMQQNLNMMYPAVYRIIYPISSQVVSNNNTNYLTEELLNQMVDTVYNIAEGDINLLDNSNLANNEREDNKNILNKTQTAQNSNLTKSESKTTDRSCKNHLLKDLIKIMILNDIANRRNTQMNMQNNMYMQ